MPSKSYGREQQFVTSAMGVQWYAYRTVTYAISKPLQIDTVHVNSSTLNLINNNKYKQIL